MSHNMHPQARLSEFDETWHIYMYSPYDPSSGNGDFFFGGGGRGRGLLLPVLERHEVPKLPSALYKANCYVIWCIFFAFHFKSAL